ncbi:MAG: site-specific DNA-methyltransferase [Bacteroidales bacterium]|nr:site-specific DNA-methyltransferase [Bacteroidales bacterium]
MTSPPYWQLRDYNHPEQLGQESLSEDYITNLVSLFDLLKIKLKDTGTCFINLGDAYNHQANDYFRNNKTLNKKFSRKSLLLLPYKFAIAMCERGWCLRNIIIWHKVNPMPQSIKDRFSVDFEPILFFTKAPTNYYFEQQLEPYKTKPIIKRNACKLQEIGVISAGEHDWYKCGGRNMPTTWSLTGENMTAKHYASYPKKISSANAKSGLSR